LANYQGNDFESVGKKQGRGIDKISMDNTRQEIDQYLDLWDQAQKEFSKEEKPVTQSASFYGMHNIPEENEEVDSGEGEHWRDIYYRSLELSHGPEDEQLVTEAKKKSDKKPAKQKAAKKKDKRKPEDAEAPDLEPEEDGFGKDLASGPGKGVKFHINPIHPASVGDDSKLRVTPNWTDGDELRQLAKLKALMYDLESELLGTDVRGGNAEPIRIKLIGIQKQCEALSQKLIPDAKTDVS
jgi:hypothetical protein